MSKSAFKRLRKRLGMEVSREKMDEYAWPGGYDIAYLCGDSGVLCGACVNKNIELVNTASYCPAGARSPDPQWQVVRCVSTDSWESGAVCDHCDKWLGPVPEDPHDQDATISTDPDPLGWMAIVGTEEFSRVGRRFLDFRQFVAFGLCESWIPHLIGDHRREMPLEIAHEYFRVSNELRIGFLGCLDQALEIPERIIGATANVSVHMEDDSTTWFQWAWRHCGPYDLFTLITDSDDQLSESSPFFLDPKAYLRRVDQCRAFLAKCRTII